MSNPLGQLGTLISLSCLLFRAYNREILNKGRRRTLRERRRRRRRWRTRQAFLFGKEGADGFETLPVERPQDRSPAAATGDAWNEKRRSRERGSGGEGRDKSLHETFLSFLRAGGFRILEKKHPRTKERSFRERWMAS